MPYKGVVYSGPEGTVDEDFIVQMCSHEHPTRKAARECGSLMASEERYIRRPSLGGTKISMRRRQRQMTASGGGRRNAPASSQDGCQVSQ